MSSSISDSNRILIIDDHPLFRKGVSQLIAMAPHLQLVGEASSGEAGVAKAKELDPDLILLDLHMKGMNGIDTLKAIREAGLDCRVVMLTVSDNADDLVAAIRSGADGYLLKDMEPEDLLAAIDQTLNGSTVIGERLNGMLAHAIREEAAASQRDSATLTKREQEILDGLARGLSNKLIARSLDITEATVKVHVKNLLKKLGFRSRLEAAVWAVGRAGKPAG
jgi:two-component system, NarL family, nitrate/nitrite response regulator NarL